MCIRLSESTPPSQNIPPFQQIYVTLPEYTPPSQNIPPFSKIICDPPRIYPSLAEYRPYRPFQQLYATLPESTPPPPESTPLFNNYVRPSKNLPSLPEYTPFSTSTIKRPSQNLPIPSRIYPTFQQLYATHPESTPPSQNIPPPSFSTTLRLCDPPRICPTLPEYFSVLGASGRLSHNYKSV